MKIDRVFLEEVPKSYLLKGKKNQADVYVIESDSKKVVVKDYYHKKGWVNLYGRIFAKREFELYKMLNVSFECFPKVFCMPDKYSLAMEFMDGKTLDEVEGDENYCFAVEKLKECVDRLNKRNIFHLDLRKRSNIIARKDSIYIIDLSSMVVLKRFSPLRILRPFLRITDLSSVLKHKQRICPSSLTDEDLKNLKLYQWIRMLWIFNKPKLPKK